MTWILETLLLAAGAPFLVFPTLSPTATVVALILIALWLTTRLLPGRRSLPPTPFNGLLLLWTGMVGVGILVTPDPVQTLPKATGLVLGLLVWRYIVSFATDPRRLRWAVAGLAVLALGVGAAGVASAHWTDKLGYGMDRLVLALLPLPRTTLPEAPEAGVSANQLAGALALVLPLAAASLAAGPGSGKEPKRRGLRRVRPGLLLAGAAGLIAGGGVLVLTQSRSGWVGGAAGLLIYTFLLGVSASQRSVRWTTCALAAALCSAAVWGVRAVGFDHIQALWDRAGGVEVAAAGTVTLVGRVEIWQRALYLIQDLPLTGCGLGTFREVIWLRYPSFTSTPGDIAHAHNMLLQVALDTGLPGLVAYLAILGTAALVAWRSATRFPHTRPLVLGLLAGVVALHVYGLTDALAPGSKPGVLFWYALGLLAAVHRHRHSRSVQSDEPIQLQKL